MVYNEYHVVLEVDQAGGVKYHDYATYGLDFPVIPCLHQRIANRTRIFAFRMVRASLKGWQYAVEHPDEAAAIVLKYDKTCVQTSQHQLSMMKESQAVQVEGRQLVALMPTLQPQSIPFCSMAC